MPNVANDVIAAYHAGRQLRMQQDQQAQEQEDRKLRQDLLAHQLRQMKLEDRMMARKAAIEQAQLTGGHPMASYGESDFAAPPLQDAVNPEAVIDQGQLPEPQLKGTPLPGIPELGISDSTVPRYTLEQMLQQQQARKLAETLTTPIKLGEGETFGLPGQPPLAVGGQKQQPPVTVHTMENGKPVTKILPRDEAMGQTFPAPPSAQILAQGGVQDAAKEIADAIERGEQPPDMKGLYRYGAAVRARLAEKGYNLTNAVKDWQAVQKHIATLNGPQQLRLRQAAQTAYDSLDVIENLSDQWKGGGYPALNRVRLKSAKAGLLGPQAQQIATQLEAQITDVASELGNVYMGGNSPTDQALKMASANLNADWSEPQLKSMLGLMRKNLQIRLNSISTIGPSGVGASPTATVKMKAPNGQVSDVPADQVEHYKSLGASVVK